MARFGWRLYNHFFKTYNEKLWGVPVNKLPADFAAQRIKNLSLSNAIMNALLPKRNQKGITSLIEEFQYPKYGPGMMWERCRDLIEKFGCKVEMNTRVTGIRHENGRAVSVTCSRARKAARASKYPLRRGRLVDAHFAIAQSDGANAVRRWLSKPRTICVIAISSPSPWSCPRPTAFPITGFTSTRPQVQVGRIQNFGSWSPYLVKEGRTCLGLEFFVFEGDETWNKPDAELIEQGKRELGILGLVDPAKVEAGFVVRMPKAYPFYDEHYKANVARLVEWLNQHAVNVHPVGRNGMHRYNNQDHSMYTAMLTAENIARGTKHDVWSVNVEDVYHEEDKTGKTGSAGSTRGTGRDAPVISRAHYGPDHPVNKAGNKS